MYYGSCLGRISNGTGWDDKNGKAWTELMAMISQVLVLTFFDPEKEVTIQCDTSQSGLGAFLMQECPFLEQ